MSPELLIAGLALLCALLTGLTGRTWRGGLYAGLVLALAMPLVMPGDDEAARDGEAAVGHRAAPNDAAPPRATAFPAVRLTQLVLPDLWNPLPVSAPNLITEAYDPKAQALQAQGLPPADDPPDTLRPGADVRLHIGITALCLAAMALMGATGAGGLTGRALLVAGLAMVWSAPSDPISAADLRSAASLVESGLAVTVFSLSMLAGLALGSLKPIGDEDPVAAALFLGTLVAVLFGGLAGWAAWAGSAEPRDIIEPVVARLAEQGAPPPTQLASDGTAAHLVHVLDHGALAALGAMIALLLHLKGRKLPTAVLVFVITVGELLVVRYGWPFG